MEVKMKNSNRKINYSSRLKSSAALSLYVVCFMFLSFRLATSLTSVACANSAADNGRKLSPGSVLTSIDPNNVNALELLRADMSVAYAQNDTKGKDQLKKIIEQIRSVGFEPQKQTPEPVIVPEQPEAVEPNETVPEVPVQKKQAEQAVKPEPQHEPITQDTLQVLQALAKNPEKLGDILFVSGNVKEAANFYSEALQRRDPNSTGVSLDRAWIMFQTGNCLRDDDMPVAAKMYQQLLTEYPNSPWADLATARNNLIAWYLKDEPLKLIQQAKHAGSKQGNGR
jgi:tetratricopeptide (TPR) repeat protein